jgi:hypothetical protein
MKMIVSAGNKITFCNLYYLDIITDKLYKTAYKEYNVKIIFLWNNIVITKTIWKQITVIN